MASATIKSGRVSKTGNAVETEIVFGTARGSFERHKDASAEIRVPSQADWNAFAKCLDFMISSDKTFAQYKTALTGAGKTITL